MKKLSVFLLAGLLGLSAMAGERDQFQVGLKLGGMFSGHNSEFNNGLPSGSGIGELKRLVGPQMGLFFEVPIIEFLEIRPEINFGSQGFRITNGDAVFASWLGYVQVPILIKGQYGNDRVRGFATVGPQFGVGLFNFERVRDGSEVLEKESYSFSDQNLKRFDAGISFGAGVEFPSAKGLELEIRYYAGLTDINDNPSGVKRTNNALMLSLGIKF